MKHLKSVGLFAIVALCVVFIVCIAIFANKDSKNLALVIPSQDEIREHGYPINERGESYGPDLKESSIEPDLILVTNYDGVVGYVRATDLRGLEFRTPEEALQFQQEIKSIDIFLQDGYTKIGVFPFG